MGTSLGKVKGQAMKKLVLVCLLTFTSVLPIKGTADVTVDRFTGDATCTGMVIPQNADDHVFIGAFRYLKINGNYFGPYLVMNFTSARPAGLGNGDANFLLTAPDGSEIRLTGTVMAATGAGATEQVTYEFTDPSAAEDGFPSAMQIEYQLNGSRGSFEGRLNNFHVKLSIEKCSGKDWPE